MAGIPVIEVNTLVRVGIPTMHECASLYRVCVVGKRGFRHLMILGNVISWFIDNTYPSLRDLSSSKQFRTVFMRTCCKALGMATSRTQPGASEITASSTLSRPNKLRLPASIDYRQGLA
jgi:hypothetical protein